MDGGTKETTTDTERAPKPKDEGRAFDLQFPFDYGDRKVTRLEYRQPVARDIVENGVPCKLNLDNYEVTFDEPKMQRMMAALYAEPPSLLAKMDPRDWLTAAWKIAPFFIPDLGKI